MAEYFIPLMIGLFLGAAIGLFSGVWVNSGRENETKEFRKWMVREGHLIPMLERVGVSADSWKELREMADRERKSYEDSIAYERTSK